MLWREDAERGEPWDKLVPTLARASWRRLVVMDKDAECPCDRIPSMADIVEMLFADDGDEAWRECRQRLLEVSKHLARHANRKRKGLFKKQLIELEKGGPLQFLSVAMLLGPGRTDRHLALMLDDPIAVFCMRAWGVSGLQIGVVEADGEKSEVWGEGKQSADILGRAVLDIHDAYSAAYKLNNGLKHPLASIIALWQRAAKPDTSPLPVVPHVIDPKKAYTLSPPDENVPSDMPLGPIADTSYLLGLALLDTTHRGCSASMALRLFVEVMTLLWQDERHGRRRVRLTLRDVRGWLYPSHPERYEAKRILDPILRALYQINHLCVEVLLPGTKTPTLWRPVSVISYPHDSLDSAVVFDIKLPPGSDVGALVDRHALRMVGVKSALKYRALLSLYLEWNRYGTHAGKRIQAKRPRVLRDQNGRLVDVGGNLITDQRGRPEVRWSKGVYVDADEKPTTAQGAVREWNPERKRYPVYTADELLTLCYSLRGAMTKSRRRRLQDARRGLEELEEDGYLTIERDALRKDGARGWRIMPPDGFGWFNARV